MDQDENGFVIKDRRSFDEKGDPKQESSDEEVRKRPEEVPPRDDTETPPLPEVNFTSLIFSLSSSALMHTGEIADPQTGEKKKDLLLAKHAIDTISMLKEKTEGNLSEEEQKFIESVLMDLKWRYVKAVK